MAIQATTENMFVVRWSLTDDEDIRLLFEKLFKYKKAAGFKSDGLDLDKNDKKVIRMFYDLWIHEEKPQSITKE
jgi:hypothetical protein